MKPIIKVENISKLYHIGGREAAPDSLRELLTDKLKAPFRRWREDDSSEARTLWALKDINFEVQQGEMVGLIGHNGAGKSTLLKILSRITEPTTGRIELYGRIGSLLEIGTGFHPELSGRENLYLNGAILGMRRAEIESKFDEIVAFSEIERFIDTPVKRYSSGMYLRLAFSVAVHLQPEILFLDEVLAVGDSAFQIKCFNKMQDIRNEGRTIIFVSHNMQAITRICKRVIYLNEGRILDDGPAHEIASTYLSSHLSKSAELRWDDLAAAPGNDIARLSAVRVRTEEGSVTDVVDISKPIGIEMEFEVFEAGHVLVPNFHFFNEEGIYLFVLGDRDPAWRRRPRLPGRYVSTAWIPGNFLSEGTVIVDAALSTPSPVLVHFNQREAVAFQVIDNLAADTARGDYQGPMAGVVRPVFNWTTEFMARAEPVPALRADAR
jgi:homopolymeric O-antigen transport system ATP-binding protein